MDKFVNYAELQAEKAENLSFCKGIKLLHVRDKVEEMLQLIGRGGIFEEYTIHNISHVDAMLKIVEWIIPDTTKKAMTYAEWLMLTLAIYFHDLGMVVTKKEYINRDKSSFKEYKNKIIQDTRNSEYGEYLKDKDDIFYIRNLLGKIMLSASSSGLRGKVLQN